MHDLTHAGWLLRPRSQPHSSARVQHESAEGRGREVWQLSVMYDGGPSPGSWVAVLPCAHYSAMSSIDCRQERCNPYSCWRCGS